MNFSFPQYLFFSILFLMILYTVGAVILNVLKQENIKYYHAFALKLFTGLLTIISIYSFYKTTFFTINLCLLFLLILWLYIAKLEFQSFSIKRLFLSVEYKGFLFALIALLFTYTVIFFSLANPINKAIYEIDSDMQCYAIMVEKINKLGVESSALDLYFKEPIRCLYHYGDIWTLAFFCRLFNMHALPVLYLIIWPGLLTICCISALALLESFNNKIDIKDYMLSLCVFFLSGISFYIEHIRFFDVDWGVSALLQTQKFCFSFLCLSLAFVELNKKKFLTFSMFMSFLIILNTTLIVSVFFFYGILFLIYSILIRKNNKLIQIQFFYPIFLTYAFIIVYQITIGHINKVYQITDRNIDGLSKFLTQLSYYKTLFNCFAGTIIRVCMSLLILTIPLFLSWKKTKEYLLLHKFVYLTIVLLIPCCALAYGIFHNHPDGRQFFTTTYMPISSIFVLLLLSYMAKINTSMKYMVIFIVLPYIFYQNVLENNLRLSHKNTIDESVYVKISSFVKGQDPTWGYLKYDTIKPSIVYFTNTNVYYQYYYLKFIYENYNPYNLSVFSTPMSDLPNVRTVQEGNNAYTPFYKYVIKQKQHNKFKSIESSQLDFIKDAKINYLFVLNNAQLPEIIKERVTDSLRLSATDLLYSLK